MHSSHRFLSAIDDALDAYLTYAEFSHYLRVFIKMYRYIRAFPKKYVYFLHLGTVMSEYC